MDGGVILGLLVAPLTLWAALIVVLWLPAAQRPAYGARAGGARPRPTCPGSAQGIVLGSGPRVAVPVNT
jgi:hypothetical protein